MAEAAWDQAGDVWLGCFGVLEAVPLGLRLVGLSLWDWASRGGLQELSSLWLPLSFAWSRAWDGGFLVRRHQPWGLDLHMGEQQRTVQGKKLKSVIPINVSGLML